MPRYIMWSHWHPNANGTDYWEALGNFDTEAEAVRAARDTAVDHFEWPSEEEQDESGVECEGPDFVVYLYDPDRHDCHRAGGGSFADDFD